MHGFYYALLWIRDILVWIWIRGSRSLIYGSGSGTCFLHTWLTRCQQNISFFSKFFAYTSVFKVKKSKKKSQNSKIKVFLTFFACWWFLWYVVYSMGGKCWGGGWENRPPPPPHPLLWGGGEGNNYAFSLLSSLLAHFGFFFFAVSSVSLACEQSEKNTFFRFKARTKIPTFSLVFALSEYERRTLSRVEFKYFD
jgi:hypothetical protein